MFAPPYIVERGFLFSQHRVAAKEAQRTYHLGAILRTKLKH